MSAGAANPLSTTGSVEFRNEHRQIIGDDGPQDVQIYFLVPVYQSVAPFIGEAAPSVSEPTRTQFPEISWRQGAEPQACASRRCLGRREPAHPGLVSVGALFEDRRFDAGDADDSIREKVDQVLRALEPLDVAVQDDALPRGVDELDSLAQEPDNRSTG